MSDIARDMRITGLQVTNDDVDSRGAAATALTSAWSKVGGLDAILGKATEVAASLAGDGASSDILGEEVQSAVRKKASAFLYTERPLEVGIVAGHAAANLVNGAAGGDGWTVADLWAATLWSILSFQRPLEDPKREALRTFVLDVARNRSTSAAEKSRERTPVANFGKLEVIVAEADKLPIAFEASTSQTIEALRRNAALDREELDFLWWALAGRSRLLERPFAKIAGLAGGIAAGIEAASHLRRLPCNVHRELVLGKVNGGVDVDLAGAIENIGEDSGVLGAKFTEGFVARYPSVFPLLSALSTSKTDFDGANIKRSEEEWASRALLEAALEHFVRTGPAKL